MKNICIIIILILFSGFSIKLSSQNIPSQDSILANKYFNLAFVAIQNGDSEEYKKNLEKAIPPFERIQQWTNSIYCKSAISQYYFKKGDYKSFEELIFIAHKEAKEYLEPENQVSIDVLNNFAISHQNKGLLKKAIDTFKEVLPAAQKAKSEIRPLSAYYQNISKALRTKGDYDEAVTYLNQILLIQQDSLPKDHPLIGKTLMDLGHLYRDKKSIEDSKTYYYRANAIFKKADYKKIKVISDYIVFTHQGLSKVFLTQGNVDSSLFHIQKAEAFLIDKYKTRQITTYEALGDVYLYQKDFNRALKSYTTSNEIAIIQFASYAKHSITARTFNNLGNTYLSNNDFENALENYQLALIKSSFNFENNSFDSNPSVDSLLSKIRSLDIVKGKSDAFLKKHAHSDNLDDLELAYKNYEFASEIIQKLRNSFLTVGSKNELAEHSIEIYEGAINAATLLFKKTEDLKYLEAAWQFAEQNKARLLEESLQDNHAQIAGKLPLDQLEKEQELSGEINFYEGEIIREQRKATDINGDKINLWSKTLFELRNKHKDLINLFEKEYPNYYALKYKAKNTSIQDVRAENLNDQNAIIEYFVGVENVYVFCITKNDLNVFEVQKSQHFEDDVLAIRSIISQSPLKNSNQFNDNRDQFVKLSHELYDKYLAPVINTLPENIKNLILIPDDILAYLPFELLMIEKPKVATLDYSPKSCFYLFEKYAISYNYSVGLLVNHSDWRNKSGLSPFTGYAPTFGNEIAGSNRSCTGDNVYTLQCNQKEVKSIVDIFGGSIIEGQEANVQSFLERNLESRILHLATHACIDENNPDLNRIYFADDYITGVDLNNLKLNAELAVLSACNTGSGKLVKGEGVMSLSRSFILAGCPSTLTSLWSVDDCTTSEIMIRYYENLKQGLSKDVALRKAKLDHLSIADKVSSHPYFWAAFIQSGNIDPMGFENSRSNYLWLLIIPIVMLVFFFLKPRKTS